MTHRAVLSFLAAAAAALAQGQPQRPSVAMNYELDGERVSITVDGDDIRVAIDGKAPGDTRVKHEDGSTVICDRDGIPVASAHRDGHSVRLEFFEQTKTAWLGIDLTPVEEALANHLGLDREKVALVTAVAEDSPAAQAGLRQHDILVRLDGQEPATLERLRELLAEKRPGDTLRIAYLRRGESHDAEARLQRSKRADTSAWSDYRTFGGQHFDAWQLLNKDHAKFQYLLPQDSFKFTEAWPQVLQWQGARELLNKHGQQKKDAAPDDAGDMRHQLQDLRKQIDSLQETLRKLTDKRKD